MTPDDLIAVLGCRAALAETFADPLTAAMDRYEVNTLTRQAAFLAQIGYESERLAFVAEIWGPTAAQMGYEGRVDLGNTMRGDGKTFKGRGLIMITGRANYTKCGEALGLDLLLHPSLLETPTNAALSAAWFWSTHNLNALADADQFEAITRVINGGLNGYPRRYAFYQIAQGVLSA